MQEGTTSRADSFSPRREAKPSTYITHGIAHAKKFRRDFSISGQPLRAPSFVHEFCPCRYASTISHFPSIRTLQVSSTPRFSIPLLSAFYPLQRLPVLLSSCTNSCKLLQLLRKALPSLFLRTSLLGGSTIRLVSWNYATRDAGRTIMPIQVPGASIPDGSRQSRRPQSAVALR